MRRRRLFVLSLPLAVVALAALSAVIPIVGSPPGDATAARAGLSGRTADGIAAVGVDLAPAAVGVDLAPAAVGAVPAPAAVGAALAPMPPGPPILAALLERRFAVDPGVPLPRAPARLTGYVWPLARGRITVDFGSFIGGTWVVDGERFHDGVDIASFCGDRVRAAHGGVVLAASRRFDDVIGWVGDLDRYYATLDKKKWWSALPITVVIADGNGYRSIYAHLSRATVRVGERVSAGQPIGYEGATGRASGCHLHFGLFSPLEATTFAIRADIAKRLATPPREIARVDPAVVLPPRPSGITLGWGVAGEVWERPPAASLRGR
jgi:murein DD-endopeptidase MepM/ murein hydrolase activator NlpD